MFISSIQGLWFRCWKAYIESSLLTVCNDMIYWTQTHGYALCPNQCQLNDGSLFVLKAIFSLEVFQALPFLQLIRHLLPIISFSYHWVQWEGFTHTMLKYILENPVLCPHWRNRWIVRPHREARSLKVWNKLQDVVYGPHGRGRCFTKSAEKKIFWITCICKIVLFQKGDSFKIHDLPVVPLLF